MRRGRFGHSHFFVLVYTRQAVLPLIIRHPVGIGQHIMHDTGMLSGTKPRTDVPVRHLDSEQRIFRKHKGISATILKQTEIFRRRNNIPWPVNGVTTKQTLGHMGKH
jgi:hypothetical protein